MMTLPNKPTVSIPRWQYIAIGVLGVVLLVANVIVTHNYFTSQFPGGNDSVPRYYGARAWMFEGLNPYSDIVKERGQFAIYGRPANDSGEDKADFAYPFYIIFFYLPVALLDWNWARAVGIVVLEVCLVATALFSMRAFRWSPPPWLLAVTVLWTIIFYHGTRTLILWQFAGVSAVLITMGLWAIKEKRDVLAGVCLALATAKPQMLFLILPLIGLWSLTARRWRLSASLAISMLALLGISFLLVPSWLSDMLRQIQSYQNYTDIGSPINTLTRVVFPFLGQPVEWVLNIVLIGWLLWEWWQVRQGDAGRFDWVLALTLVITNMVALRTATTNYVMMIPALIYLFSLTARRWGTKANIAIVLVELALFVGLWVLFVVTVKGRIEQPPMYLPLPFLLLGWLIAVRKDAHAAT
jgi:hypothetical protein